MTSSHTTRRAGGAVAIATCLAVAGGCGRVADAPLAATRVSAPSGPGPSADDPSRPLVGLYGLTLHLGAGCEEIPAAERTRGYAASIRAAGAPGHYVVTVESGHFLTGPVCTGGPGRLAGMGCHQFFAGEDRDVVSFTLPDEHADTRGGHIVQHLPWGGWLELSGAASGRYRDGQLNASGEARVSYCPERRATPFDCAAPVTCVAELGLGFER